MQEYKHQRGINNLLQIHWLFKKVLQENINPFEGWGAEEASNAFFFFVISVVLLQKDLELLTSLLAG